jgi:hypothetical protein
MSSIFYPFYQDSLYIPRVTDTLPDIGVISPPGTDSVIPQINVTKAENSGVRITTARKPELSKIQIQEVPLRTDQVIIPEKWNSSSNFFEENGLKGIVSGIRESSEKTVSYGSKQQPSDMMPGKRSNETYDWLLGIFLFLVVLFVWIRVFYSKFFSTLANALSSFQLSVKLFQERNILSHRVSIVLDFIYIIVTTIFVFELIEYTGNTKTGMTGINLFLLLLNILMLYAILRVVILRLTGSLFMSYPLFMEYIHNTFVINKGLGIILFPIVIMIHYLPYKMSPVMLILGVVLITVALLFKSFRAYQIIIRRDILIFYLILYLCTLEILPLLLGYKFVTSLIQSN